MAHVTRVISRVDMKVCPPATGRQCNGSAAMGATVAHAVYRGSEGSVVAAPAPPVVGEAAVVVWRQRACAAVIPAMSQTGFAH